MAETFFTSGNQMVTTEIDVDSPTTEGLMSKIKGRDVELSDKIQGLGGTGADGDVTITANTDLYGIKHYNNLTINSGVIVTVRKVSAGSGTVSTTTTTATFSVAHGLRVGDRIRITTGAQANEEGVVVRIDSSTSVLIRTSFSANQSNQSWNKVETGIPLLIFARGTVTINGSINADGAGGTGGTCSAVTGVSNNGESFAGGGSGGGGGDGSDSGSYAPDGGSSSYLNLVSPGGNGGYNGGNGGNGSPAPSSRFSIGEVLGGAGGGGGRNWGGEGGDGGGGVYIEAPTIVINSVATITCNGTNGAGGAGTNYGGGGGGGGGVIFLRYKSLTINGTLTAAGGTGGIATAGDGGNGGAGVVYTEILP